MKDAYYISRAGLWAVFLLWGAITVPAQENRQDGRSLETEIQNLRTSLSRNASEIQSLVRISERLYRYDLTGEIYTVWASGLNPVESADSAVSLYRKALQSYARIQDSGKMAESLLRIGVVYGINELPDSALASFQKAAAIAWKSNDNKLLAQLYNAMGNTFYLTRNLEKAAACYRTSIRFSTKAQIMNLQALSYSNLGNLKDEQMEQDSALIFFGLAGDIALKIKDTAGYVLTKTNMAAVLLNLRKPVQALAIYDELDKIPARYHPPQSDFTFSTNRGIAMMYLRRYEEAHAHFARAKGMIKNNILPNYVRQFYISLSDLYREQGNYERAYHYYTLFHSLSDSLSQSGFTEQMAEMQARFERDEQLWKKDLEHQMEIKKTQGIRNVFIAVSMGLLIALALLLLLFRVKKSANARLTQAHGITRDLNHKLLLINEIGETLTTGGHSDTMIHRVYEASRRLYPFDAVAVGLYEQETGALVFQDAIEKGKNLKTTRLPGEQESPAHICFRTQNIVIIRNLEKEWSRYYSLLEKVKPVAGQMMRTVIYAPLTVQGRQTGVITWQAYEEIDLGENPVIVFNSLAAFIAIAIENQKQEGDLMKKNQEMEDTLHTLEAKEILLKNANQAKDRLFSVVAHDLRNPFNSILGFSRLLAEETETLGTEEISTYAKTLNQASRQAYDLLENLLEWSSQEMGMRVPVPAPNWIEPLITQCLNENSGLLSEKNIRAETELAQGLVAWVDGNHFRVVFRNLLINAIKFSFPDTIIKIRAFPQDA